MSEITWEEYRKYVSDELSQTFDLDTHPEGAKRSTYITHTCFCKECRDAIDQEYEKLWKQGVID